MYKLLSLLRFFSLSFFFVIYVHASIVSPVSIDMNSTIDGEWTTTSDNSPYTNHATTYYTFTLMSREEISVELSSLNHISKLYLLDSNHNILQGAEAMSSYDSATIIMTLDSGTYIIDATTSNTLFSNELGSYNLRVYESTSKYSNIELNTTINNAWNSSSGVSSRSHRFAAYYHFSLSESKNIVINLDNSSNMKVFLLDENNTIIESALGHALGGAQIITHLGIGTYTIDATTEYGIEEKQYTLKLRENSISNHIIDLNSSIYGDWTINSGISSRNGLYSNYYTFTLNESREVVIDVDSCDDAMFYLLDINQTIINQAQNFGGCYESARIVQTLNAGTYIIDVTKQYSPTIGNYVLNLRENTIKMREIIIDSSINSDWTELSPISPLTNRYAEYYTFSLSEKTDIYLLLESSEFVKLLLHDQNGTIIGSSYGSNSPESARIVRTLDKGSYIIEVTTYFGAQLGNFLLTYGQNSVKKTNILFNQIVQDNVKSNSGYSPRSQNHAEQYTFTLTESKEVNLTISQNAGAVLYLLDSNNNILDSLNTDISQHNTITKKLIAGTYRVEITTYMRGVFPRYSLIVNADIDTPSQVSTTKSIINAYGVTINWVSNSHNTVGYKIYLDGTQIADVDASNNSYTIGGLSTDSEYSYSIVAYNSAGESNPVFGNIRTKKDDYAWLVPIQHMILN